MEKSLKSKEALDEAYKERDALHQTAEHSECLVCGRGMTVARRKDAQGIYQDTLVCPGDPTHVGYRKRRSLTQQGIVRWDTPRPAKP